MKQRLTYTKTSTIWPVMPTVGTVCIIAGDYSRDNMGVLKHFVS